MKQTCILVLGMHRSGTSAFTGILDILGVYLGKTLMQSHKTNEKGFFENERIYEFHGIELLPALHSSWDDTNYLEDNWQNDESLHNLYSKAKEIILSEYDEERFRTCFFYFFANG